jgi:hypothetical protein
MRLTLPQIQLFESHHFIVTQILRVDQTQNDFYIRCRSKSNEKSIYSMHCLTWLAIFLQFPLTQSFPRTTVKTRLQTHCFSTSSPNHSSEHMILPIFPLRKTVKVPTDSIQLTLWEQRYLALARYVLNQDRACSMFGALYCSHKSYISKGGDGPLTPLIDVGDVGVVCCVQKRSIFKDGTEIGIEFKDDDHVDKIQLIGLAVGRFQVEKILSNGFDTDKYHLPFILVEASRIDDEDVYMNDVEDTILEFETDMSKEFSSDEYKWAFEVGERGKQMQQLISFALIAKKEDKLSAVDMLHMLYSTSTTERMTKARKI